MRLGLVLCGAGVILFPALSSAGLERAEIYFLDAARAMLESGDWLVPHYQGQPFFDKPALTYWLMAAAMEVLGPTRQAGRAVSGLAALGLLLATAALGAHVLDRRAALAGAIALATSVAFMSFGRVAMSDMLLALLSTLSVLLAFRARRGDAGALTLLGLVLGLGFLTKGPIALLLPGLGILLLAWRTRRDPLRLSPAAAAAGAVLFAIAGLGWFLLVYLRLGLEPLAHFFLRENLQRFAASTYDSGRGPFFYFGAYVAMGAPWSLCLPIAAWRAWRPDPQASGAAGARYLLAWSALMLVPLSLSRGKIDYYLLPLLPPLCLVLGRWLTGVAWSRRDRDVARVALVALGIALAASPLLLRRIEPGWIGAGARQGATAAALAGAGALAVAAARVSPRLVLGALAAVSAATALVFVTLVVPGFLAAQPTARIVRDVGALLAERPGARVVLCQDPTRVQRDILFESRTAVEERCDLWAAVSGPRPAILLATDAEFAGMRRSHRLRLRYKYRYLPANLLAFDAGKARPGRLFLITNEGRLGRRHRAPASRRP